MSFRQRLTCIAETLNLYVYNVHCKQIIFGASADNGYASFLSSFFVGTDVSSRIRILKGPPFSYEFKTLLPQFKWTEFTNVFRSDFISHELVQHLVWRKSQELESQHARDSAVGFTVDNEPVSSSGDYQGLYATNTSISEATSQLPKELTIPSRPRILEIDHDGKENGVRLGQNLQQGLSPSASSTSSGPTLQGHTGQLPTASEAAAALIASTNEFLQLFPKNLDFGAVKQQAAQRLGVTSDFWLDRHGDEWFSRSKNIIKMAVVSTHIVQR